MREISQVHLSKVPASLLSGVRQVERLPSCETVGSISGSLVRRSERPETRVRDTDLETETDSEEEELETDEETELQCQVCRINFVGETRLREHKRMSQHWR